MPRRRFPAEWEPQDGVLISWPHLASDWAEMLDTVEPVFSSLAAAISHYELVVVVAPEPEGISERIVAAGGVAERIITLPLPTNDTWSRDFGPLTVIDKGKPLLLDFGFNGWGLKFAADYDNLITRRMHKAGIFGSTPLQTIGLILEGGSIESDGAGTLLTTADCLLNGNRNPHLGRQQLEEELQRHFGCDHILWLEHGHLLGDDTDSHIDTLARLGPEQTILYVACDDPGDPHFPALLRMEEELRQLRTRDNKPFRLLRLPWPRPCFASDGQRLPATYANYLVLNNAVLVPTYADTINDRKALEMIGSAFPGREVIAIDCRPLIEQHGSLHCVTMQLPAGVLTRHP